MHDPPNHELNYNCYVKECVDTDPCGLPTNTTVGNGLCYSGHMTRSGRYINQSDRCLRHLE